MKLRHTFIITLLCLVVPHVNAEERIFLGDLKPMKVKVGFGTYNVIRDGSIGNEFSKEFLVNEKPAQKGLLAHADSEVIFAIPTGVTKFTAVGTGPNFKTKRTSKNISGLDMLDGSWTYEVLIDGVQVYESEPLCAFVKREVPIQVDIPENARYITLKTHMLSNGHSDWSIWGEPYFIKP
jgi:hypothetical protein